MNTNTLISIAPLACLTLSSCSMNSVIEETGTHKKYSGLKHNIESTHKTAHVLITHGMGHQPGSLLTFKKGVKAINKELTTLYKNAPVPVPNTYKNTTWSQYKEKYGVRNIPNTSLQKKIQESEIYEFQTPTGKKRVHYHWVDYSYYLQYQKIGMTHRDQHLWSKSPGIVNRVAKKNILNWGFSDAALYIKEDHKSQIVKIFKNTLNSIPRKQGEPMTLVSTSLGSVVLMDAFNTSDQEIHGSLPTMNQHFMLANQIPLINVGKGNKKPHVNKSKLPYSMVAFSDPSDPLTYRLCKSDLNLPKGTKMRLTNVYVSNKTWCIPWILKNPNTHSKYHLNPHVIKRIVHGSDNIKTHSSENDCY